MINFYTDNDLQHINDNLDKIEQDALQQSYKLLDPTNHEYNKVRQIIADFIKNEKRIVYGGSAYHAIIQQNNNTVGIYRDFERYDTEFYSPDPIRDMVVICNKLDDAGINYVIGRQAQHDETFTIFANFNQYCDMSYMPAKIFEKIEYIEINGTRYIHPDYILIDIFRMYNDPLTSYWRLGKVFKRMKLLMSEYEYDFKKTKPVKFKIIPEHNDLIDFIVPELIKKFDNLLFVGQLGYEYYMNPDEKINSHNINQIEIICEKNNEVGKFIKNLTYNWCEKNNTLNKYDELFSVKFYNRYFQYWAPRSVIYYKNEPVFTVMGHFGRCLPFNKLQTNNMELYIGSFLVVFNYYFVGYHYETIIKNGFYYEDKNILNSMLTKRNDYLKKNNKNVLDATIYKDFIINCVGKTLEFSREFLLRMNERREKGLKGIITYDPKVNRGSYLGYDFDISDGTEIESNE